MLAAVEEIEDVDDVGKVDPEPEEAILEVDDAKAAAVVAWLRTPDELARYSDTICSAEDTKQRFSLRLTIREV